MRKPKGIAVSPDGSCIFITDHEGHQIQRFDRLGNLVLTFGPKGKIKDKGPLPEQAVLNRPAGLALGPDGLLYVADQGNDRVQAFGIPEVAAGGATVASAPKPLGADPIFRLGEVYAYPNPAKGGKIPKIHVEAGISDGLEIRIYGVSGNLVHQANIAGPPAIIDDGQGPEYAYEYVWEGYIPSGVYIYVVEARKQGAGSLKKASKLAVIR